MPRKRPSSRPAPPTNWGHLIALSICGAAIHLGPLAIEVFHPQLQAETADEPPMREHAELLPATEHAVLDR